MPQPTVRRSLEATFDETRTMETYAIPLSRPGVTSQGVQIDSPG